MSRVNPSTPSAMNRACHLHTTGFDLPDRRIISAVPQPSAVARMMLAAICDRTADIRVCAEAESASFDHVTDAGKISPCMRNRG